MFSKYVLILVWIGFMAAIQRGQQREEFDAISGENVWRVTPLFAFIVFVPVLIMAANRGYIGDTIMYLVGYHNLPLSFSELIDYMQGVDKDPAYSITAGIIHVLFGNQDIIFLGSIALFQAAGLAYFFRKYSVSYVFSVFMFIASTDYISWMFNGIRQFIAVIIIIIATPFMVEERGSSRIRNNTTWIIAVIIASTFHRSALLMLPLVYICKGEPWNKKTVQFMVCIIAAIVFVGRFTGFMNDALQGTQYANVVSDYTELNDDGTNPLRVVFYSIPAILSFIKRKEIAISGNKIIHFCTNMSVVSMGLYLVSMVTSGIFIGRLPIYASLYAYVLFPWVIDLFHNRNGIKIIVVLAFVSFYYVQMHLIYGLI